jgi:hypothetical protein
MPEFMCQWENCHITDTPIIVSEKDANERNRFCCIQHAALYLLQRAGLLRTLNAELLAALRGLVEDYEGAYGGSDEDAPKALTKARAAIAKAAT